MRYNPLLLIFCQNETPTSTCERVYLLFAEVLNNPLERLPKAQRLIHILQRPLIALGYAPADDPTDFPKLFVKLESAIPV